MSTFTQILYQIVFSTKYREKTLLTDQRPDIYKYISGIIINKQCHLYQIGGIEDHVHIITHLHPTQNLSKLVQDIKVASSKFIKENKLSKSFSGWQVGYGAFTYSIDAKYNLIEYVKNQEAHHQKISFIEEYKRLLKRHQIDFDENYLL